MSSVKMISFNRSSLLLNANFSFKTTVRFLSSFTTSVTKVHRNTYCRNYPTLLVFPDGSSTTIRHHEPRQIITLPVNLNSLSDDEKRLRMEKRRPKTKIQHVEALKINFDPKKYINLVKKK